jgi:predicted aspartyl protease/tetratricopeptide (TPR) repeat protein
VNQFAPEWPHGIKSLDRREIAGHFSGMKATVRACAPLFVGLCVAWSAPVLAETKCKVAQFARFPVTMDGPRATVPVKINGKDTRIWLDSGAFFNFMPKAKAVELGLTTEPLPVGFTVSGIGGSFTPELATVRDFGILGVELHHMQFVVGGSDPGNGFLGANFLGVWDTEFDLAKGTVNLFKESGCNHVSLAYWGAGMAVGDARLLSPDNANDHHIYVEVVINGHPLRAILDTGAPDTIVSRHAAQRAGIDLTSPTVVASMRMSGVGSRARPSWIARTQTISIGGEEIRNSPIRVIDEDGVGSSDMLLGVDFLISHHVLVSQTQRRMFLTYNGGPVFSVTTDAEIGHMETRAENMGGMEKAHDLKTADEFAGRGSGRLTRGDYPGAIADYSEAIKLAPARTDLLADRARAYIRTGQRDRAAKDIDAALALAPADHRLLTRRAQMRLARGDRAGALADTEAAAKTVPKGSLDVMPVAMLYERLGKADRGLALIDPVIVLHRDDSAYPGLLNARCWNRALANAELDQALKDCSTAIRKAGANPAMLDSRALVQLRRKDYAAAIADADAALAKAPKMPSSLYVKGLARIASGDATGGKADLADARAISPAIDARFAEYGLAAPKDDATGKTVPAQPQQPDGDDDQ